MSRRNWSSVSAAVAPLAMARNSGPLVANGVVTTFGAMMGDALAAVAAEPWGALKLLRKDGL
jgi:hypothetical protein